MRIHMQCAYTLILFLCYGKVRKYKSLLLGLVSVSYNKGSCKTRRWLFQLELGTETVSKI